ncbi:MAG TPA: histidine phosphatase family protein [Candidatus Paceibacterota bacterium]
MVTIIFEAHGTTVDNEARISSGQNDAALSELGEKQAVKLGERYKDKHPDAIFCSDLERSYKTAEIAFAGKNIPIIKDTRLRECDYGEWSGRPSAEVEPERGNRIDTPFPGGESYEQTTARMGDFLNELKEKYDGKTVMIIGHRATQYGLEHLIKGLPIRDAVVAHWQWQPGWTYALSG